MILISMTKIKGIRAERELIHMLWNAGWSAVRIAGSGSMRYPSPDIIAGKGNRKMAIECKSIGKISMNITRRQIDDFKKFCSMFGAEPWLGVRFDNLNWFFLNPEDLKETEGKNFVISIELAKRKGLSFEQLTEK